MFLVPADRPRNRVSRNPDGESQSGRDRPEGGRASSGRQLPELEPFTEDDSSDITMRLPSRSASRPRLRQTPTLRVGAGRDMLRFTTLEPGKIILIGRDESADLRINDITVSKRHARVVVGSDGDIVIHDLDSTNGTSINARQISRAELKPGDHLEVGAVSVRLDLMSDDELRHLAQVVERLESANRDPLTGLLTRAWLDDDLPTLAEQYARAELPFSCAFVDVDHFKSVNDRWSHAVGDDVLSAIARLLMLGVRDADPCVRYGGEEIVLFLPGSDEVAAVEVAERVRAGIANHEWSRTAEGLLITASFGVAVKRRSESIRDWIGRADRAVYAAKHAGRNRVICASSLR
jgi:two-component system, cell cycle response regulator